MTTTAHADRLIGPKTSLTGFPVGGVCADCGRECPARIFIVENRDTGEQRLLGSECARKATGTNYPQPADEVDPEPVEGDYDWMFGPGPGLDD